jgi:hypothetical protein
MIESKPKIRRKIIMSSLTAPELRENELDFFERLNYFFGKLLTVRDFLSEQSYFNEKRWLLNRQTIGWGVVCGLEVVRADQCPSQVIVKPGLALDQYGYEVFVGKDETVDLFEKEEQKAESPVALRPTPPPTPPPGPRTFFVGIRYRECFLDPVPAPVSKCGGYETHCKYSRVRELYELQSFEGEPPVSESEAEISCDKLGIRPCEEIPNPCKTRRKCQWLVLAEVTVEHGAVTYIDNNSYRKWLWSNEDLAKCLVHNVRAARIDRRQFVPLLAQTIKGIKYHDGRILTITDQWESDVPGKVKLNVGIQPYDITTDGEFIWYTDTAESADKTVLKINREGTSVEKLSVEERSWGIAFDGCYMWVTHPDEHSVSKIPKSATSTDTLDTPINIRRHENDLPNPKDIIFAKDYVWIARNGGITRIDVKRNEVEPLEDYGFTPIALAFDGTHIWLVHNGQRVRGQIKKIDLEGNLVPMEPPISVEQEPKCLVFDGTHMWVTQRDGASQIDINENEVERKAAADNTLTGAAFDGAYLWVAEPEGRRVDRINIYTAQRVSEFRPSEHLEGNRHFAKMCFDGMYIWVTDYTGTKGVIHRLLV